MKTVILALLAAASAWAQIEVYTVDAAGKETSAPNLLDVGQVYTGAYSDTRMRLRNLGPATATLQTLRISGAGFSLIGYPPLPYLVSPGTNVDFRIRFQPTGSGSYSATLLANTTSILVQGSSPKAATLSRADDAPWTVEKGLTGRQGFLLRNDTGVALEVRSAVVAGESFYGPFGLSLPLALAPGESAGFEVEFAPLHSGIFHGSITVDGHVVQLEAAAFDPPLPAATLSVENTLPSGTQGTLSIRFAEPPRGGGTATVKMEFQGSAADPAVVFVLNSARSIEVAVNAGEAEPAGIIFQTGTTAGTIVFTVQVGLQTLSARVDIAAAPVAIDRVGTARTSTGVQVEVTGFDNTRTVSGLAFTFYDLAGKMLGSPVQADAGEAFAQYFQQSAVGGMFLLRAVFPVAGDIAQIGAVEVEMANSAGSAKSTRASF